MQMIQLQVNDNALQQVLMMLNSLKEGMIENLEIVKDKNLEYDSYFYERREHIVQTIKGMESGKINMCDFNNSMDELIKELEF